MENDDLTIQTTEQEPAGQGSAQEGADGGGERMFTQAELDAAINRRLARERKGQPSAEELAAFREYQRTHAPKTEAEQLRDMTTERDSAQTELELARRENDLLRHGIPADDVDYYVFKISKLATDDKDFEAAAKEYLKGHKTRGGSGVRVDMSGRLSGSGNPTKTANETMNDLLRAARG